VRVTAGFAVLGTTGAVLAQTVEGWEQAVRWLGPAAPFAAVTLWMLREQIIEAREARKELRKLHEKVQGEVVPALVRSDETHAETTQVLERVTVMLHQLAGRPGTQPEVWSRVMHALERGERRERDG
jgi:hypothetical protein